MRCTFEGIGLFTMNYEKTNELAIIHTVKQTDICPQPNYCLKKGEENCFYKLSGRTEK